MVENFVCSDLNEDLINLWNLIKNNPEKICLSYSKMWNKLIQLSIEEKKEYFYMVRNRFNKYKDSCDFMFIMRTTTNGMPRYNLSGNFNNSFHVTRNGMNPNKLNKIIVEWSDDLNKNNVQFLCQSYSDIKNTEYNDIIYLDPPYANTKGMYYGTIDYEDLWNWMRISKGIKYLSFDGKTTYDNFTQIVPKDLYKKHEYLQSGNSSFRRVIGKSSSTNVYESLYTI